MRFKLWFVLCVLFIFNSASCVNAQEISPTVKKKVVQNYKANFSEVLPTGSSNCTQKPKGDANCDGLVNEFDLSIWEIEYNSPNNPRRSDFNSDGFVNLVDYGIWRNTFYPKKTSGLRQFLSGVFALFTLPSSLFTAQAQENNSTGPQVNSSNSFIGSSGDGFVTNSLANGNTQQVNFNKNATIASSQLFSNNGLLVAGISYLDSGATVITTQQEGIPIQVSKAATGAIFQSFKNPDGSLITLKTWPSQESYDRNDPPLSVTLPGRDNKTLLTLNIQPNGGGILNETDSTGKLLNQRKLSGNGLYISVDAKSGSVTQAINKAGLVSLSMPNNLGGQTTYYFINNKLIIINQTDSKGNFYSAIPKGQQWELLSIVNNQQSTKLVDNPIAAIGSNTPSPSAIVSKWNYYLSASKTQSPAVDFGDTFNSSSRALTLPVGKSDQVYSIALVPPQVLGIIKEVKADADTTSQAKDGVKVEVSGFTGSNGQENMTVSVFGPGETGPGQTPLGSSQVTFQSSADIPDVSNMSPAQAMSAAQAAAAQGGAQLSQFSDLADNKSLDDLSKSVPADTTTQAPPPAAPAPVEAPVTTQVVTAPVVDIAPIDQAPPPPPADIPTTAAPAAATQSAPTYSVPGGFDPGTGVGPSGSTGNVSFSQSYSGSTNSITANFADGSIQVSNLNDGTVSFTYGADAGDLANSTVGIGTDGHVSSITTSDGTTYNIEGTSVTLDGAQVTDSGILGTANEAIDVNNEANGRDQDAITGTCFLPGTLISTPQGQIPIEKLKPGQKVYSFNEKTGKKEVADFKELDINFVDEYLIINNKVKTTTYHPFYVKNGRELVLKKAGDLNIGDLLINEENKPVAITSIQKIEESVTVYNLLEVSPNNNFYAENLLVHNYGETVEGDDNPVAPSDATADPEAEAAAASEVGDEVTASADASDAAAEDTSGTDNSGSNEDTSGGDFSGDSGGSDGSSE